MTCPTEPTLYFEADPDVQLSLDLPASTEPPTSTRKRKRLQLETPLIRNSDDHTQTLSRTSPSGLVKGTKQAVTNTKHCNHPIEHWIEEGFWPKHYVKMEDTVQYPFARSRSTASLRRKASEISLSSESKSREGKSAPYRNVQYENGLALNGGYMTESKLDITMEEKHYCRTMLDTEQEVPKGTLFEPELFKDTCEKIRNRNEARIIRDISQLIVPSAENLATYGASHLEDLVESVNECWSKSIAIYGPRPQPDFSVGYTASAFTVEQRKRLEPFTGGYGDESFVAATPWMLFPFLAAEVKCANASLEVADRQNAHSMTIAVRAIVRLFQSVKREQELHRRVLAFSISHDASTVRIYGHYPIIEGDKATYFRYPIRQYYFTSEEGKDRWSAYKFTRNVYDKFMPDLLAKIRSAIDELPPDLKRPPSVGPTSQQSRAQSMSLTEGNDNQADFGESSQDSERVSMGPPSKRGRVKEWGGSSGRGSGRGSAA